MMTVQKIRNINMAKMEDIKNQRKEISALLSYNEEETARLQAEKVLIETNRADASEILASQCNELHARTDQIALDNKCPDQLKQAVCTLIWAATRLEFEELGQVKSQLVKKYGSKFAGEAERNDHSCVHPHVSKWLSKRPPTPLIVGA